MNTSFSNTNTIYGSGNIVTETRPISAFNRVDVKPIGILRIKQGNQERLVIETDDNLIHFFEAQVIDRELVICIRKGMGINLQPSQPIIFNLWVKQLREINLSGAVGLEAPNLDVNRLSVMVRGAVNVDMPGLHAKRLTLRMSGAGSVRTAGRANQQNVTINGTGKYRAGNLISAAAEVSVSGTSAAELWVHDHLDAKVSGCSVIRFYGNPGTVRTAVHGLGSIEQER
jgi:hypothetical protein